LPENTTRWGTYPKSDLFKKAPPVSKQNGGFTGHLAIDPDFAEVM
jgi:hypothetical protein